METDDEWEKFKKSVNKLESDTVDLDSQKIKPTPVVRQSNKDSATTNPSLAVQFYNLIKFKSLKSLISKVYNNTGIGAPPISGGKIEGKNKDKIHK
jgi:hypothetical protein